MLHTIRNQYLSITVSEHGAELQSILGTDGIEYLWQGDPAYWTDRAINLFPYIGRLTEGKYTMDNKLYQLPIHGLAPYSKFVLQNHSSNTLAFELRDTEESYLRYPRHYSFRVIYRLQGRSLKITYEVENLDRRTMYFGLGGHPGFNVPLLDNEMFEDYELEFRHSCQPDRVGFSPAVYLNGQDHLYPLRDNKYIDLCHNLFDEDAVILKNMDREVTMRSRISGRGVTLAYPGFPYLGIWHCPKTAAPYVCIEPWSSLPSRQDIVEEFSCKSDLIHLAPSKTYETTWSITVF